MNFEVPGSGMAVARIFVPVVFVEVARIDRQRHCSFHWTHHRILQTAVVCRVKGLTLRRQINAERTCVCWGRMRVLCWQDDVDGRAFLGQVILVNGNFGWGARVRWFQLHFQA